MIRGPGFSKESPMELRQASFATCKAVARHLSQTALRDLTWYAYYFGPEMAPDEICGVCSLLRVPTGGRIRDIWIKREWRGNGFGTMMTVALIELATTELLMPRLEALTNRPGFYVKRLGWTRVGERDAAGRTLVARNY